MKNYVTKLLRVQSGNMRNMEHRKTYMQEYREDNKAKISLWRHNYRANSKLLAFQKIIGGPIVQCQNCGCDDFRLLEINHKNGGGQPEIRKFRTEGICREIIGGRRTVEDLEVLCRVCNALDYLKHKYGEVPITVTWRVKNGN